MIGLALSTVIAVCDSFAISFPSTLSVAEGVANQKHLDYIPAFSPFFSSPRADFDRGVFLVAVAREERDFRGSPVEISFPASLSLSPPPPPLSLGIIKRTHILGSQPRERQRSTRECAAELARSVS